MKSNFNDPWLDALASNDEKSDLHEAELVRRYFAKRAKEDSSQPIDATREARMVAYLKSKNAFSRKVPQHGTSINEKLAQFIDWLIRPAVMSAVLASVTLMVVGSLLLKMPTYQDGIPSSLEVYRGNQSVVKIVTANPAESTLAITKILQQQQVPYRVVNMPDNQVRIEAKVTKAPAETEAALSAWKLMIPKNGVLIIQLSSKQEN